MRRSRLGSRRRHPRAVIETRGRIAGASHHHRWGEGAVRQTLVFAMAPYAARASRRHHPRARRGGLACVGILPAGRRIERTLELQAASAGLNWSEDRS
jgi:hypothetical protein